MAGAGRRHTPGCGEAGIPGELDSQRLPGELERVGLQSRKKPFQVAGSSHDGGAGPEQYPVLVNAAENGSGETRVTASFRGRPLGVQDGGSPILGRAALPDMSARQLMATVTAQRFRALIQSPGVPLCPIPPYARTSHRIH